MDKNVSGLCPYCHQNVTYSWVYLDKDGGGSRNWLHDYFKNSTGSWLMGECPSCKRASLFHFSLDNRYFLPDNLLDIFPSPLPSPVDQRIPEKIKKDLEEAKLCFSVNAINACVAMCRKALQRACKEAGATKKDLIDEIAEKKIITETLKDLAHGVRSVGNDGVHPNEEEVLVEDAEEILKLTKQFMEMVFVTPAKIREIKERRLKK